MLSDYLLGYAAEHYGFEKETLRFVADGNYSAKHFYAFSKYGKTYILRFIKRDAGLIAQTKAEMDWLCYLAEKGVGVSRPIKTAEGEFAVSADENGETYIITAYSKAEGRLFDVNDPNLWNDRVFTVTTTSI